MAAAQSRQQWFRSWIVVVLVLATLAPIVATAGKHSPQMAFGVDSLNADLSYGHAQKNLAYLRVPGHDYDRNVSTRIHYIHNISRSDGSHDMVHYNVSHVVGVVSLDVSSKFELDSPAENNQLIVSFFIKICSLAFSMCSSYLRSRV